MIEPTQAAEIRAAAFKTAALFVRGHSADERFGKASISTALCAMSDALFRMAADELEGRETSSASAATAHPWHTVLLGYLVEARAKAARNAANCRGEEVARFNEGSEVAYRIAVGRVLQVVYGAEAAAAYLRDGTLPEPVVGDYEAVLAAELTRLARTMIDPGAGSDVGDQVAVVMGIRDHRMRQLEAEVARLKTEVGMLGGYPAEPTNRDHIGGNAEDCPGCDGTNPPYPFICPGSSGSTA